MEMAEEKIAERIDANLNGSYQWNSLNIFQEMSSQTRLQKIETTLGKLIIKEYPTGAAHSQVTLEHC